MTIMNNGIEVYVAVGARNVLAGRLYPHSRRGAESASFIYNDKYLADPTAYALVLNASNWLAQDAVKVERFTGGSGGACPFFPEMVVVD
jgi:hypothetical protein